MYYWGAESSCNAAADHNLDLSLGNPSSKHGNSQALGNHTLNAATDQHMQSESNWRNGGGKPYKVHEINKQ